jgi:integrase
MAKEKLTDLKVKALKPAPAGRRYEVLDAVVPGLGVRVTDKGQRTFVLIARYPGSRNPTRRALGEYPKITLEKARDKARQWLELLAQGIDPRQVENEAKEAARVRRAHTFGVVAESYIEKRLRKQRQGRATEREIRKELISRWQDRPITSITKADVIAMVEEIAARAPRQAHNMFGRLCTLMNWAVERDVYGLAVSPCDRVRPSRLIGPKAIRQRVLDDDELRALWDATRSGEGPAYPYGALVRLLMLTGQRKAEVAGARWREIDLERRLWTIPPERFKSDAVHVVPLADPAMALLAGLPRFAGGDYLFSSTHGRKPVNGFSNAKIVLEQRLAEALGAEPERWVLHDIRRTVRTRLSGLRVPDPVAEMVIGHARKGLARVYDQHQYLDEMREALDAWAMRLRSIVEPPATNVVALHGDVARA